MIASRGRRQTRIWKKQPFGSHGFWFPNDSFGVWFPNQPFLSRNDLFWFPNHGVVFESVVMVSESVSCFGFGVVAGF